MHIQHIDFYSRRMKDTDENMEHIKMFKKKEYSQLDRHKSVQIVVSSYFH